jgi:aminoglycoside phosphotransferase (APT) family kinase protein
MPDATWIAGVRPDPRLPALGRAVDAAAMAPVLDSLLGDRGEVTAQVLKHVPGKRCVLAYAFADGSRIIGKMYRKDRARRHAAILTALGDALVGATRVPRLLGCVDELGLVLQEWVPGEALPEYAAWTAAEAARLGAALADLHATPLACAPDADLAAHERRTCHPGAAMLAAEWPELGADVDAIRAALRATAPAATLVTSHGDPGPRAAFAAGRLTWLVDLDGVCRTDPAFDVATVRVGLEVHRGEAGHDLAAAFLAAYRDRGGPALPALRVHEAFCDLRRAMILWRKRPPGWNDDLRRCLARGRERL